MNTLLKSAKIIDPQASLNGKVQDILIKNGVIAKIADSIAPEANTTIVSLDNLHVSVGWFDSSICFGEPGFEDRETLENGLNVAAKSGFTDIALNPYTQPVADSGVHISSILHKVRKIYGCKLHPVGALSRDAKGCDLAELYDMKTCGAIAFGDYKTSTENANLLKIALQYAQNFDGLVYSYPQDKTIASSGVANESVSTLRLGLKGIPNLTEDIRIARDLAILEYTGGKLHIPTISTVRAVELIAQAKKSGLDISCSVSIHNLMLTDDLLSEFDTNYKVLPPLRTKADVEALKNGLLAGTIDFVTSDHCPLNIEEKRLEFDDALFGTIGLESAFGALHSIFDLDTTISLMTKGRSRFGIETPILAEGHRACLTCFDPHVSYHFSDQNILSTSKNSVFLGYPLRGKAYGTILDEGVFVSPF